MRTETNATHLPIPDVWEMRKAVQMALQCGYAEVQDLTREQLEDLYKQVMENKDGDQAD